MSKSGQIARILVVDDSEESSAVTAAFLRIGGFERIEFARSGEEALAMVGIGSSSAPVEDEIGFDLILLDIVMPDMDGIEVCARLRINQASRHVPILMLTASREVETLNQAFVAGADDFVSKPVDEVRLLVRVRTLLRMRREQKRRQLREADLRLQNLNLQRGQLDAVLIEPVSHLPRDMLVEQLLRNCRELGDPAALALIQIADFAHYRELHGNQLAERLFHRIAGIVSQIEAPLAAIPCAYGQGSYMVVHPGATSADRLAEMCTKVRAAVTQEAILHGNSIGSENVEMLTQTGWSDSDKLEAMFEDVLERMNTRILEMR